MSPDELLAYLFNEQPHPLAAPMALWLASSRRFTAFVLAFRAKIRKKLLATQESESLLDLRLELETAYKLLQERALSLVYEPQPARRTRGPDFAVTFTTSTRFMVEVTRLRTAQDSARGFVQTKESDSSRPAASERSLVGERLTDNVCSKLGQLSPQCANILLVGVEASPFSESALLAAMRHLQQRAERNEAAVIQRHQFRDRAGFFRHYQQLSELLVCGALLQANGPVIGWINPQAKHPLPGKVRTALYRSLRI